MRKLLVVAGIAASALGLTVWGATGAMVNAGANSPPILTVDATNATLVLPTPPDGTQWGLFIFKVAPDGSQTLAGQGNAGVGQIQVPLPLNYCGEVQVDIGKFTDDGTFHKDVGHKYEVSTCTTPTTTTTIGCPPNDTPPPCTTTTTPPPSSTSTTLPTAPPSTTTTSTAPGVVPSVPSPPISSSGATPDQLPDIAPAVNGETNGNG